MTRGSAKKSSGKGPKKAAKMPASKPAKQPAKKPAKKSAKKCTKKSMKSCDTAEIAQYERQRKLAMKKPGGRTLASLQKRARAFGIITTRNHKDRTALELAAAIKYKTTKKR